MKSVLNVVFLLSSIRSDCLDTPVSLRFPFTLFLLRSWVRFCMPSCPDSMLPRKNHCRSETSNFRLARWESSNSVIDLAISRSLPGFQKPFANTGRNKLKDTEDHFNHLTRLIYTICTNAEDAMLASWLSLYASYSFRF